MRRSLGRSVNIPRFCTQVHVTSPLSSEMFVNAGSTRLLQVLKNNGRAVFRTYGRLLMLVVRSTLLFV